MDKTLCTVRHDDVNPQFLCILKGTFLLEAAHYYNRVRVTDRHCRHLRRKIKFGTKKHKLAKISGEKNIT